MDLISGGCRWEGAQGVSATPFRLQFTLAANSSCSLSGDPLKRLRSRDMV